MLPGRRTSAIGGRRRPGDRVVAAEDDRDGAGAGDLEDLAVDQRVGPLDPGRRRCSRRRHRRRSRTSNGSTSSWSELIEPDVYCASRIARGPNRAPGRWLTASSNGAPTMATSTSRRSELVRVGDPRQLHERHRTDVGRQVEVGVGLERPVPAVLAREVALEARDRGGGQPPDASGDGRGRSPRGSVPSRWGAPPVRACRPAGRATADGSSHGRRRGRPGQSVARNSCQAAATRAGIREQLEGGLGDERGGEQGHLVGAGRGGGVAEQDRMAGRALGRDGEVRVDGRADPADVGHVGRARIRVVALVGDAVGRHVGPEPLGQDPVVAHRPGAARERDLDGRVGRERGGRRTARGSGRASVRSRSRCRSGS